MKKTAVVKIYGKGDDKSVRKIAWKVPNDRRRGSLRGLKTAIMLDLREALEDKGKIIERKEVAKKQDTLKIINKKGKSKVKECTTFAAKIVKTK